MQSGEETKIKDKGDMARNEKELGQIIIQKRRQQLRITATEVKKNLGKFLPILCGFEQKPEIHRVGQNT